MNDTAAEEIIQPVSPPSELPTRVASATKGWETRRRKKQEQEDEQRRRQQPSDIPVITAPASDALDNLASREQAVMAAETADAPATPVVKSAPAVDNLMSNFPPPPVPVITTPVKIKEAAVVPMTVRICACGCDKELITTNESRFFLQGHDAKLKSRMKRVIGGKDSPESIPDIVIEKMDDIPFLRSDREGRKVLLSEKNRRRAA